mmetsp:Transcript_43304/g.110800  ORF Transcript_43304/g.110800 Transcript_43304/m.110800 type:complete len:83 (-) Transcript_43304:516-764(-)|eukprot:jgi/Tetstr1/455976/TSEL_042756.t1
MSKPPAPSESSALVQRDWENRRGTADLLGALQELSNFVTAFDGSVRERLADLSARLRRLELLAESIETQAGDRTPAAAETQP